MGGGELGNGELPIRPGSGEQLVGQNAQAVDVRFAGRFLAGQPLRAHVPQIAQQLPDRSETRSRLLRIVSHHGNPEVGQKHAARVPFAQHVAGLHIPVHDSLAVRGAQRPGHLRQDLPDFRGVECSLGFEPLREASAVDVFHDQVWDALLQAVHAVDRHDVGMDDSRRQLAFPLEAGRSLGTAGEHRREHLDRDQALEGRFAGQVDAGRSAVPERPKDLEIRRHPFLDQLIEAGRPGSLDPVLSVA